MNKEKIDEFKNMSDEGIIKNIRGIKVEKENYSLFNNTGLKINDKEF